MTSIFFLLGANDRLSKINLYIYSGLMDQNINSSFSFCLPRTLKEQESGSTCAMVVAIYICDLLIRSEINI